MTRIILSLTRFDRAGYDAVFIVAMSVLGIDIILRLLVMGPKRAPKWTEEHSQEESNHFLENWGERNSEAAEPVDKLLRKNRVSIPPIVRLAMSGQLLVVLVASAVDAILYNMFETVCF